MDSRYGARALFSITASDSDVQEKGSEKFARAGVGQSLTEVNPARHNWKEHHDVGLGFLFEKARA